MFGSPFLYCSLNSVVLTESCDFLCALGTSFLAYYYSVVFQFLSLSFVFYLFPVQQLESPFLFPYCSHFLRCINFTLSERLACIYSSIFPIFVFSFRFVVGCISPFARRCPVTSLLDRAPPVIPFPRRAHVFSVSLVPMCLKRFFLYLVSLKNNLAGYYP